MTYIVSDVDLLHTASSTARCNAKEIVMSSWKNSVCFGALAVFVSLVAPACASSDGTDADESSDELRAKCGGIAGIQCKQGYECVTKAKYPDAMGSCYKQQMCGGIAGISCPTGYTCVMSGPHHPDQAGLCSKQLLSPDPCANTSCPTGQHCTAPADVPSCVADVLSRDPCANYSCPIAHHCTAPADVPTCVSDWGRRIPPGSN